MKFKIPLEPPSPAEPGLLPYPRRNEGPNRRPPTPKNRNPRSRSTPRAQNLGPTAAPYRVAGDRARACRVQQ